MGLMPATGVHPFTSLDTKGVVGTLRSCGSRDPDVLYAQKQQLIAPAKHLKLLGIICMVGGAFFTLTIILAIAGIPLVIFGWWLYWFGGKNIRTVESGYAEFLASAGM